MCLPAHGCREWHNSVFRRCLHTDEADASRALKPAAEARKCDNKQCEFPRLAPPQGWQAGNLWKDTGPGHDSQSATSSAAKCRSPTAGIMISSWQAPPAAAYLEGYGDLFLILLGSRAGEIKSNREHRLLYRTLVDARMLTVEPL